MREANKLNSKFVLFVGGEEFTKGEVQIKNMLNGEQQNLSIDNIEILLSKIEAVK